MCVCGSCQHWLVCWECLHWYAAARVVKPIYKPVEPAAETRIKSHRFSAVQSTSSCDVQVLYLEHVGFIRPHTVSSIICTFLYFLSSSSFQNRHWFEIFYEGLWSKYSMCVKSDLVMNPCRSLWFLAMKLLSWPWNRKRPPKQRQQFSAWFRLRSTTEEWWAMTLTRWLQHQSESNEEKLWEVRSVCSAGGGGGCQSQPSDIICVLLCASSKLRLPTWS